MIDRYRRMVNDRLAVLVPEESTEPRELHRAMRYSLLAGGKRIRPVLTMLVAESLGGDEDAALNAACAIEMVHAASLILDDLPCMDDATLRRGRPANHLAFGEDTAILAATALLNRAFGVVAECESLAPEVRLRLISSLSNAVGSNGIIAGQYCDLHPEWRHEEDLPKLLSMYGQKTGALFVASVEVGARVAGVDESWVQAVRQFAIHLGLAFQIFDDLLDHLSTVQESGKDVRQDDDKTTFVTCMGSEPARAEATNRVDSATQALEPLGEAARPLVDLAHHFMGPSKGTALQF
jgi:geranylgeranyl diphosphate synthase type II